MSPCLSESVVILLVGMKSDLEHLRQVNRPDAIALAASHGAEHIEASAKTGDNVDAVFYLLRSLFYFILFFYFFWFGKIFGFEDLKSSCQKPENSLESSFIYFLDQKYEINAKNPG